MSLQNVEGEGQAHRLEPSYDMSEIAADIVARQLIDERFAEVPKHYRFVGLEIEPGDTKLGNLARRVERVVFDDKFGNGSDVMEREYGQYEAASRFFISLDRQKGRVSGALRIIQNSPAGLKSLNDMEDPKWDFDIDVPFARRTLGIDSLDDAWDAGTVAVLPEYQGGKKIASVQLYRAMHVSAKRHGVKHLVAMIDSEPLADMRNKLGIPFQSLAMFNRKGRKAATPHPYIDSPSTEAVYGYVPEFDDEARYHHRRKALVRAAFPNNPVSRLLDGTQDDAIVWAE